MQAVRLLPGYEEVWWSGKLRQRCKLKQCQRKETFRNCSSRTAVKRGSSSLVMTSSTVEPSYGLSLQRLEAGSRRQQWSERVNKEDRGERDERGDKEERNKRDTRDNINIGDNMNLRING